MDRMTDEQFIKELEKRADAFFNECIIEELEKIRKEMSEKALTYSLTNNFENDIVIGLIKESDMEKIIDKHILELKGSDKK